MLIVYGFGSTLGELRVAELFYSAAMKLFGELIDRFLPRVKGNEIDATCAQGDRGDTERKRE